MEIELLFLWNFGSGFVWLHNTVVGIIQRLVFSRLEEALKIRSSTLEPQRKASIKVRPGCSWSCPGQIWALSGMELSLSLWAVPVLDKFDDRHIFLVFLGISHVAVCVHCPSAFQCVYCSQKCGSIFFMIPLGHLRYQITANQAFSFQVCTNLVLSLFLYVLCTSPLTIMVILSLMSSSWPSTGGQKILHVQALLCWGEKYWAHWLCPAHAPRSVAQLHWHKYVLPWHVTWRFSSSSSAGQAVFGAGWHWHWWHNWPWGVMATDGTWVPGLQAVAFDTCQCWHQNFCTQLQFQSYSLWVLILTRVLHYFTNCRDAVGRVMW